jgi:hypothetical protein
VGPILSIEWINHAIDVIAMVSGSVLLCTFPEIATWLPDDLMRPAFRAQ